MSFSGSGQRKGPSVISAAGVVNIDGSAMGSFFSCVSLSAASISSFNQPIALAFRFSYGQCSRVSRIKARRK